MRDMPRLLRDAGLRVIDVDAHVYADVGDSTFVLNAAEWFAVLIAPSSVMPAAHVQECLPGCAAPRKAAFAFSPRAATA